ncbi:hypothetical protein, partial [Nocardia farcinica]|uniref:hypothetical protein n=1 Tax=Nocardia farcinica TaxID=37329 RepID=UPI002455606F
MTAMPLVCRLHRADPYLLMCAAALSLLQPVLHLPAWVFLAAILAALAPLTVGYRHEFHGECPTLCYTRQPVEGPTPHGL